MTDDEFKIEYPNGHTKKFPTRKEALEYVEAEMIAWKPLTDLLKEYEKRLPTLKYDVQGEGTKSISTSDFAGVLAYLKYRLEREFFETNKPLVFPPPSQSILGELILGLIDNGLMNGALASYFAYVSLTLEPEFKSVRLASFNPYYDNYVVSIQQGFQLLDMAFVTKAIMSDNEKVRRLSNVVGEADQHQRKLRALLSEQRDTSRKQAQSFSDFQQQCTDEYARIKAEFYEHMRVKAPVKLWEKRATEHRQKAKTAQWTFIALAAISILFCLVFPYFAGDYIASTFVTQICSPTDPTDCSRAFSPKGPLTVSALLLLLSLLLWVIRLQYRLFLSERHLTLDAEEKQAFAETYLALRKDDQVKSDSEAIVLASLFRPTQDGIIRDDESAMDFSTAAILAKAMGKNA